MIYIYRLALILVLLLTTSLAHALKMGPIMASSTTYAPSAPVSVSGAAGNGQVTVTWSAGAVDGTHSAATSFNLWRGTSSGGTSLWQSGVTSPYTDTASNGTGYYYKVEAVNSAGSTLSTVAGPYTPAATVYAPNIPVIGTATAGNAQASVAFTASVVDGTHSAATSYTATSSPGGFTATGSASPLTVTGLTNGTAYTFTVTATNAVGASSASSASNSVTPSASTWYLPGSTTTGQVEFAYNAKGAASYAASKSNLASPGTHDATDGTAAPTWAAGTGWTFNGTSQYLVASTTSGATKPFTMIARVNIPDTTGQYTMIGGGTTGNATWRIRSDGKAELDSLNTAGIGNSTGTATAGSSHVYAVTYSGTGVWTYYIDGVASGTGTTDVTFAAGAAHKIGTQTDSGNVFSNWFKGSMQAVAKYNVVLSGGDIASLSTVMAGL